MQGERRLQKRYMIDVQLHVVQHCLRNSARFLHSTRAKGLNNNNNNKKAAPNRLQAPCLACCYWLNRIRCGCSFFTIIVTMEINQRHLWNWVQVIVGELIKKWIRPEVHNAKKSAGLLHVHTICTVLLPRTLHGGSLLLPNIGLLYWEKSYSVKR